MRDISFLQRNSNSKCKSDERNTKSLLGKCHSNNCCRQDPPIDAKISGSKCEKQYISKNSNLTVEKYSSSHLNKAIKVKISPAVRHTNTMYLLI